MASSFVAPVGSLYWAGRASTAPAMNSGLAAPSTPASATHESLLSSLFSLVKSEAGNASAALSIVGVVAIHLPIPRSIGNVLLGASMVAGGVDTVIQGESWLRGEPGSSLGTTLYAATGMLPCGAFGALKSLGHMPTLKEAALLGILAANVGLAGFETFHNSLPKITSGKASTTDWLNFLSGISGFKLR